MPIDNPFAPLKTALKFLAFPAEVILVDHFLRHNHRWGQSWSLKEKRISEIKLDKCFTGNARPLCLYAYDARALSDDFRHYLIECIRLIRGQTLHPDNVSENPIFKECFKLVNQAFIRKFIADTPPKECIANVTKVIDTFLIKNCDSLKERAECKAYILHTDHIHSFTIDAAQYYKDTPNRV